MGDPGDAFYLNGVNGASGETFPPLTLDEVSRLAQGERLDPQELAELTAKYTRATGTFLGVIEGVDETNLAEAGWGVIFAADADPAIVEALRPLLEHRKAQAGSVKEGRYREYTGPEAYRPDESNGQFLVRHGVSPGNAANPDLVPYYLLIVGDPETIPYRFQYTLDATYAVGRIHFDTPQEYARYAESVVAAETGSARPKTAAFFGVRNDDDRATPMSADHLITPLAAKLTGKVPGWTVEAVTGADATKARLGNLLGGDQTPALLLTASHGMWFPKDDPQLPPRQGALLCQDWPGPIAWQQPIPPDFYLAGEDVADDANVAGTIVFLFACFGAGTPKIDDFAVQAIGQPAEIAPRSMVARLPQRLLGHPKGGALAVVGHVERAWSFSFLWPRLGEQLDVFESTLTKVMKGVPVGSAVEYFNDRYAALTVELEGQQEDIKYGKTPDATALSDLWTSKNDARNYVIIGDPAVRLG